MTSSDSVNPLMIESLDRISELPFPIILQILSYLPLDESARASILSKTWKSVCSLYPILHFDHKLFALQFLASCPEGCGGHGFNEIRDLFMDDVDNRLTIARQSDSPIRSLLLSVIVNDLEYSFRVDKSLQLVKQMNVDDLCILVDHFWPEEVDPDNVFYDFPVSLLASKGLRSVHVGGAILGHETFADEVSFSFLKRLSLSNVDLGYNVVGTLTRFCQGLEMLVLDSCTGDKCQILDLSKFPKLKIAIIIKQEQGLDWIECVDIVGTNLECFTCVACTDCHISPDACAGIREITLKDCCVIPTGLFKDLTATFPLIELVDVEVYGTDKLKAVSNVLRMLKFENDGPVRVEDVHIDCPSLTLLDFSTWGLTHLYVDCPNLRVFCYDGNTVPERVFLSPVADLVESSLKISVDYAYDTLWFIKCREFLELVMASPTYVDLSFHLPMATFEPEQFEAFHASPRCNVHLTLSVAIEAGQNAAALMDAVLWIIRPTTLIVGSSFDLLKYLCESLIKKSQGNICDEQVTTPCWLHQLEDFQVESSTDTLDITKENLDDLPKQCPTFTRGIRFKFLWS